jgi:hypothetical protein
MCRVHTLINKMVQQNVSTDILISTAVFLINTLPSKVINNETPYERLLGHQPDYSFFGCFGVPFSQIYGLTMRGNCSSDQNNVYSLDIVIYTKASSVLIQMKGGSTSHGMLFLMNMFSLLLLLIQTLVLVSIQSLRFFQMFYRTGHLILGMKFCMTGICLLLPLLILCQVLSLLVMTQEQTRQKIAKKRSLACVISCVPRLETARALKRIRLAHLLRILVAQVDRHRDWPGDVPVPVVCPAHPRAQIFYGHHLVVFFSYRTT